MQQSYNQSTHAWKTETPAPNKTERCTSDMQPALNTIDVEHIARRADDTAQATSLLAQVNQAPRLQHPSRKRTLNQYTADADLQQQTLHLLAQAQLQLIRNQAEDTGCSQTRGHGLMRPPRLKAKLMQKVQFRKTGKQNGPVLQNLVEAEGRSKPSVVRHPQLRLAPQSSLTSDDVVLWKSKDGHAQLALVTAATLDAKDAQTQTPAQTAAASTQEDQEQAARAKEQLEEATRRLECDLAERDRKLAEMATELASERRARIVADEDITDLVERSFALERKLELKDVELENMEQIRNDSALELAQAEAKRIADMDAMAAVTQAEVDHLKKVIAERDALAAQAQSAAEVAYQQVVREREADVAWRDQALADKEAELAQREGAHEELQRLTYERKQQRDDDFKELENQNNELLAICKKESAWLMEMREEREVTKRALRDLQEDVKHAEAAGEERAKEIQATLDMTEADVQKLTLEKQQQEQTLSGQLATEKAQVAKYLDLFLQANADNKTLETLYDQRTAENKRLAAELEEERKAQSLLKIEAQRAHLHPLPRGPTDFAGPIGESANIPHVHSCDSSTLDEAEDEQIKVLRENIEGLRAQYKVLEQSHQILYDHMQKQHQEELQRQQLQLQSQHEEELQQLHKSVVQQREQIDSIAPLIQERFGSQANPPSAVVPPPVAFATQESAGTRILLGQFESPPPPGFPSQPQYAPTPSVIPAQAQPCAVVSNQAILVAEKSWPKFDGSGCLHSFLSKLLYFMHVTSMKGCDKHCKLIQLLRGRAFTWLSHHNGWQELPFEQIVELLQKEYGASNTRDMARLERLQCGKDLMKFNAEFNDIGRGCRDILPEEAQKFRYIRLVKPEEMRQHLQAASNQLSLQQLQSLAIELQDLIVPLPNATEPDQRRYTHPANHKKHGGRRSLCSLCKKWHKENERCRPTSADTQNPHTRGNRPGPRWTEAQAEQEEDVDAAAEEMESRSTSTSETSEEHY